MSILSNRFYLKLETGTHFGGSRILAATHLPRVYSLADAMELAAELIKLAGGLDAFRPYAEDAGLIPASAPAAEGAGQVEANAGMLVDAGQANGAVIAKYGEAFTPAELKPAVVPIVIQEPDQAQDVAADSPAAPTSGSSPDAVTPAAS